MIGYIDVTMCSGRDWLRNGWLNVRVGTNVTSDCSVVTMCSGMGPVVKRVAKCEGKKVL